MTIAEHLAREAASQPDRRAFTFLKDGAEIATSYGELDASARSIARTLAGIKAADGQRRALLLLPQSTAFVEALFGCFYAGTCAVPAHLPSANSRHALERLRRIARDARPDEVIATRDLVRLRDDLPELASVAWLATEDLGARNGARNGRGDGPRAAPSDLAILQYSSGSTGHPRGVMVAHDNLVHNEGLIHAAFEHERETVVVGWLPFQHDMGLIGNVLQPVYAGAQCVLMSPVEFLKDPLRWLRAIARYRGTTSGAPNFAYELCARRAVERGCEPLDLSTWSLAYVGAEPVRADTLARFAEVFAPHGFRREALYPCYGLAEATLLVTGGLRSEAPRVETVGGRARVSCGPVRRGLELAIVDPATRRRTDDEGEVWVTGTSVARGYFGDAAATEATFGGRLDGDERTWLRTGDLGRLVDGELFVTGRIKDVVVVRGAKHAAEDLEQTVEELRDPALRGAASVAFALDDGKREQLVIVREVERGANADWNALAQRIVAEVAREHGVMVDVVAFVRAGAIPRTTSGKVRRAACRDLFARGELDQIHHGTRLVARA